MFTRCLVLFRVTADEPGDSCAQKASEADRRVGLAVMTVHGLIVESGWLF